MITGTKMRSNLSVDGYVEERCVSASATICMTRAMVDWLASRATITLIAPGPLIVPVHARRAASNFLDRGDCSQSDTAIYDRPVRLLEYHSRSLAVGRTAQAIVFDSCSRQTQTPFAIEFR
jgi:hypothetical protein